MVLPTEVIERLSCTLKNKKILVTGGAGFLGHHIVSVLLACDAFVSVFDVVKPSKPIPNADYITGNLLNLEEVKAAVRGCFAVVHTASPSPTSTNEKLFYEVNVNGTKNVIDACKSCGVEILVFTSSASVVFDGDHQRNLDETSPPPRHSLDAYTKSKLAAEELVLASCSSSSSSSSRLRTLALRPHGIFGPGDPHLVPRVSTAGMTGKSRYILGDGANLVDFTYVENVAYAHALAITVLADSNSTASGQAYFITNSQPVLFWAFMRSLYTGLGFDEPWLNIPVHIILPIAHVLERIHRMLPAFQPTFNVQAVRYATTHHYYSCEKARRELGYIPPISLDQGIKRTLAHFSHLKNPSVIPKRVHTVYNKSKVLMVAASLLTLFAALFVSLPSVELRAIVSVVFVWMFLMWFRSTSMGRPLSTSTSLTPDSLKGKTVVISGGGRGIGYETAIACAAAGARVIITSRSSSTGESSCGALNKRFGANTARFYPLDLASYSSVRSFVNELKKDGIRIDALVNNAGAMIGQSLTVDGGDAQWQSNALSPLLLSVLCLREQLFNDRARIVNVASFMNFFGHLEFDDLHRFNAKNGGLRYNRVRMYCDTKLANVALSHALDRQLVALSVLPTHRERVRVRSMALHPGVADTEFIDHFIPRWLHVLVTPLLALMTVTRTPADCARSVAYCVGSPLMENIGGVYMDNGEARPESHEARDVDVQNRLWEAAWRDIGLKATGDELF